ncbi:hypothetical protein OAG1_33640 [Agarivorans sp. OAG1]|uniref:hypothetical protein n=1 Tax=Agarivorans sp. OAG1 TaxID=3082387 RepID=UPI002B2E7111|nr:hypothetical protein OAG1_33640 [Agarivorans sp. OAG1]
MLNGSAFDSFKQQQLENRLSVTLDQERLFKEIDKIQGLTGAAVVYIDSQLNVVELRKFRPVCQINPIKVVLREPLKAMGNSEFANHLKTGQSNARESRLVGEIAGAALSCGAAVLGWVVVIGSGSAIPLTGGVSSVITYTAVAAASASSVQCGNSLYRTFNEIQQPEVNDQLDSQKWYTVTSSALDIISLAGAATAGVASIKAFKLMQATSGKPTLELLNGLTRAERARLTKEIIRLNHPGVSNAVLKTMVRNGVYPKRYAGVQITNALKLQLKDAVGASMSFSGSALSGTVKGLAIGIHQELAAIE